MQKRSHSEVNTHRPPDFLKGPPEAADPRKKVDETESFRPVRLRTCVGDLAQLFQLERVYALCLTFHVASDGAVMHPQHAGGFLDSQPGAGHQFGEFGGAVLIHPGSPVLICDNLSRFDTEIKALEVVPVGTPSA